VSVILSKNCKYTCVLFRTVPEIRVISLYSSKIAYKTEILGTVSNIGTYCSGDKVGTVICVKEEKSNQP
jgi:hypothetical protein